MASDPTDLIREADEALADRDRLVGNMGMLAVSLVRRLRDALAESRTEAAEMMLSRAELADEAQKLRNWRDGDARRERDEVAAAQADRDSALQQLAEERVTVYQFQQCCRDELPDLDDNCGPDEVASAIHMLRVERNNAFAAIRNMQENNLHREAALAEANATIEKLRADPRDEHHSMAELYEYRMLYNAHAAVGWLNAGYPVVKSWKHSDGELCFGGGWFVVSATLPTGQVSNHYAAEHWGLFRVPDVALPPAYDGHTPAEAAVRIRRAIEGEAT